MSVADKAGWSPLHLAAYKGHAPVVEHLLKAGCKIDQQDAVCVVCFLYC